MTGCVDHRVSMERRTNSKQSQYRLDDKTRFALKLIAHQKRQTDTAVVVHALRQAATLLDLGGFTWADLYDEHEGMRLLKCLACPTYETTPDEDELLRFVQAHRQFFYADPKGIVPRRTFVEALWPKIDEYRKHWLRTRGENPGATAELLTDAVLKEGLPLPKAAA